MYNLNYVTLRYFNVYGPRMDTDGKYTEVLIRWLNCIKNNQEPIIHGDGSASMDLIHVKDVANANILAMNNAISNETFNIGTQKETTLNNLLLTLLKVNNSSLKPINKSVRTINSVNRRYADIKANLLLKFKPTIDLEDGLIDLSSGTTQVGNVKNRITPLTKPTLDSIEILEIKEVIDSGWLTQGPKVAIFEKIL